MKMQMLALLGLLSFSACAGSTEDMVDEAGVPLVQVDPATGAVVRSDVGDGVLVRVERDGASVDFIEVEPGEIIMVGRSDPGRANPLAGPQAGATALQVFASLTSVPVPAALRTAAARAPQAEDQGGAPAARLACHSEGSIERIGYGDYTSPCHRSNFVLGSGKAGPEGPVRFAVDHRKLTGWARVGSFDAEPNQTVIFSTDRATVIKRAYRFLVGTDHDESWSFNVSFQ
jgi:hypothetical protein